MPNDCVLVRSGSAAEGRTGVTYAPGVSARTAGTSGLCLALASLPPGGRARAHRHDAHESAAYVIEGELVLWFGERLEHRIVGRPGDFIYIPSGVPHLVVNASPTASAVTVLARNDASEQEDVTELPELDALPHLQVKSPV